MPDTGTAVRAGFVNIDDDQSHNKFKPAIGEVGLSQRSRTMLDWSCSTQAMAEALKHNVTRALERHFQLGLAMLLHAKEPRAEESTAEGTFDAPNLRQLI